MRSVFAHLKEVEKQNVVAVLDEICDCPNGSTGEDWLCLKNDDPVLYIGFYTDYQEYEPDEWQIVVDALGCEPAVSVVADVSGRHNGKPEVMAFLKAVLKRFNGVAQDDYTAHAWSLQELELGSCHQGHPFFDTQGWYQEK